MIAIVVVVTDNFWPVGIAHERNAKSIIKELIQTDFTEDNVTLEIKRLLDNPMAQQQIIQDYSEICSKLNRQNAAENAANEILNLFWLPSKQDKNKSVPGA